MRVGGYAWVPPAILLLVRLSGLEGGTFPTPERLIRPQLACRSDRSRFQVRSLRDQILRSPLTGYTYSTRADSASCCDCGADPSGPRSELTPRSLASARELRISSRPRLRLNMGSSLFATVPSGGA